VYLYECVVSQTVVQSLCEQGEVLGTVQSQHRVQKPRATGQHHGMELRERQEDVEHHAAAASDTDQLS